MTKKRAFLFVLMALAVGALGGGWGVAHVYSRIMSDYIRNGNLLEVAQAVRILKHLRAGNTTNDIEFLEIKLDGALVGIWSFLSDVPESRRDPGAIKILKTARDYRTQFPRKSLYPETDDGVAKTFLLLNEQSAH